MADMVRGAAPPAPKTTMEIRRVKSTEPTQYLCLSKSIWGQLIHWYGGRSHECTQDKKTCQGCKLGWPIKWLGYLHVQAANQEEQVFLEITNIAFHLLQKQLPEETNLRGVMFRIKKTKGGAKGRFLIEVLERRLPSEMCPRELDPYPTLQFLWSCKRPARHEIG